jgi:hypothetical protein
MPARRSSGRQTASAAKLSVRQIIRISFINEKEEFENN